MEDDPDRCYEALASRDARFDGRFFAGVTTTGVYCRPVCPARTPQRENIRFFACAAAAEEAGFRPCRRCRPETSPGTPAWLGTSATVSRALRLIAEGALDEADVGGLTERLGIGERHLRRLFARHLGASPVAVAQTRRIHFARNLIDQTALPMSEIAFAAGFGSLRRFNDVVRRTFGRPPRALRGASAAGMRADGGMNGTIDLRLPFRPPYDWEMVWRYLAARAVPGVESVTKGSYRRAISVAGRSGTIEVTPDVGGKALRLRLGAPVRTELVGLVEKVRRIFDLGADPRQITTHLARDPLLRRVVKAKPGLRVPGTWDGFELAVRAVLGQQVAVKAATTMCGRLAQKWGTPVEGLEESGLRCLFPSPAKLAVADLESIGVTRGRARAIRELAAGVERGEISLAGGERVDEMMARLARIPGIGEWTVSYIAMRALGEPDAFPAGDLGLRRALSRDGRLPSARELVARAEAWRPWRAYAVMYLWNRGA